ncbi:MAG: tetratricopeptide repeat protein [Planctomycetes bacterium]|nr:tetratricopeptide repeat protein [Planctomycetota bacterium]
MKEALPLPLALAAALYLPTVQEQDPQPKAVVVQEASQPPMSVRPTSDVSELAPRVGWHPRALALIGPRGLVTPKPADAEEQTTLEARATAEETAESTPQTTQEPVREPAPQDSAHVEANAPQEPKDTPLPLTLEENEMRVLMLRRRLQEAERRLDDALRDGPIAREPNEGIVAESGTGGVPPHPLVHPDHARAARAFEALHRDREARDHWLLVDSPWARLRAAECLERMGQPDDAARELESLRQRHPDHPAAREARQAASYLRWRAELRVRWPSLAEHLEERP